MYLVNVNYFVAKWLNKCVRIRIFYLMICMIYIWIYLKRITYRIMKSYYFHLVELLKLEYKIVNIS